MMRIVMITVTITTRPLSISLEQLIATGVCVVIAPHECSNVGTNVAVKKLPRATYLYTVALHYYVFQACHVCYTVN